MKVLRKDSMDVIEVYEHCNMLRDDVWNRDKAVCYRNNRHHFHLLKSGLIFDEKEIDYYRLTH